MIEIQLKDDKKKWYVYSQGISPLFYRFEGIQSFRIYKRWIENHEFQQKDITGNFLKFQRVLRQRIFLKQQAIKYLRKMETGEVLFSSIHRK
jgi:hypothetical protein